jgi:plasmid stabilization system protein ParE
VKQVGFRPAAAADVEAAYEWYEEQRFGLGGEFLAAVEKAMQSISEQPDAYPIVHRGTRRILLARFPYGLYYRIVGDQLVVVACMHAARHPLRWRSRK